ncbi:MAG: CapA family protein [Chitinophagaceae bacterium]|nr:MAG: CapA family protein [Chitinophagaceae bacterium]
MLSNIIFWKSLFSGHYRISLILVLAFGFSVLNACTSADTKTTTFDEYVSSVKVVDSTKERQPKYTTLTISAVGDIMVHQTQINAQRVNDSTYDFTNNFAFLSPYFNASDILIGNLETTLAGSGRPYSGYPKFNTPDALAEALKIAGFHIISTANNHLYDMGGEGMLRTLSVLEKNKLLSAGTRKDTLTDNFILKNKNEITIGFTSYTYESPKVNNQKTINGLIVKKEHQNLINSFDYEKLNDAFKEMKVTVDSMKSKGAEVIIFYLHWGNEYHRSENHFQREIADSLNRMGVDIIFGSHPHVLQPVKIIQSPIDSHITVVAYSLGNFISNQRYETLNNRYTEDGVILNIEVNKNHTTGQIQIKAITYTPTWVHRYYRENKPVYEILPLPDVIVNADSFKVSGENLIHRLRQSFRQSVEIIEKDLVPAAGIQFESRITEKNEILLTE